MSELADDLLRETKVSYARERWRAWQASPMTAMGIPKPGANARFDVYANKRLQALLDAARDPGLPLETADYDMLVMLSVSYLRDLNAVGELPRSLALFLADVLEGKRQRPTKRGPDENRNLLRNAALREITQDVARRFEMPDYSHNELSSAPTAAEIVAEAAGVSAETVIDACQKSFR